MPWSGKRSASDSPVMTPSAKVPNVSGSGLGDGEWICQNCGNLNHAGRAVCNMRKCGAPKPEERWTCFCGNENYAGRLVCNLRKCGMLKPGLKLQDLAKLVGGGGAPQLPAEPAAAALPRQKQTPPGSWKCIDCGNVNFPNRDVCNGRNGSCAQPRANCDGGPPDDEAPAAVPSNLNHTNHSLAATLAGFGKGGAPTPKANPMMTTPKASGPMNAPPGSWVCKSCMNVNFPTRTTCNSRNCGMPRDEVDGGPPGFQAPVPSSAGGRRGGGGGGGGGDAPPGSWTCDACSNINWPGRTSCNRRSCGLPRST